MTFTRAIRRLVCQLMAGVLLFAQMAVAAYACAGPAAGPGDVVATMQMAMVPGDAPPAMHCAQMDSASKALCAEHCHGGQHSADTASPPAVQAALPLLLYVLPSQPVMLRTSVSQLAMPCDAAAAAPPPPHAILHCVLRI